jgi:hypothetical protein
LSVDVAREWQQAAAPPLSNIPDVDDAAHSRFGATAPAAAIRRRVKS